MQSIEKRESFYKLLSRIFLSEMDEDSLKKIENSKDFDLLFPEYSTWEERTKRSRYKLINEVLNVDYTDIAIMHLVPYESFYVRDDAMIESGGANPITQLYNEYGYRVNLDEARAVSGDHFGIELGFMTVLLELQKEAYENKDIDKVNYYKEEQSKFLKEHILQFAPMYLINIAEQARTPFYKDSAKLAIEFLLEDLEYLAN